MRRDPRNPALALPQMSSEAKQWQCQLSTPVERLAYLRKTGYMSDLTITFPGRSDAIKAHRWMLAVSSPVFEAMLCGPLVKGDILTLPEDPPKAFEWLLDHLYKNKTKLPDVELAMQVYQLANKYQLDKLFQICSEFLSKNVTGTTFLEAYEFATLMDDQKVLSRCDDILARESDLVLRSERLGILRPHNLARLLANNRIASSESLLFRALLAWGRAKLDDSPAGGAEGSKTSDMQEQGPRPKLDQAPVGGAEGSKTSDMQEQGPRPKLDQAPVGGAEGSKTSDMQEQGPRPKTQANHCPHCQPVGSQSESQESNALRNVVKEFLPSIRFLTMSTDEFVEHVLPSRVLTSDEALTVLMNIKNIPDVHLPNIASCTSRKKRSNLKHGYPRFLNYSSDSEWFGD
ncbi:uncharacterized protein LOC122250450 [Penaeus japonicus]|uniref:uncharacterized protein LOC122250450 n=1 Tax=Penaeus japonicus TaxID=27405 RepID=UPI001C712ABE|nr:uncharacterized protein LOC122250450 [Penaeus japonicus]